MLFFGGCGIIQYFLLCSFVLFLGTMWCYLLLPVVFFSVVLIGLWCYLVLPVVVFVVFLESKPIRNRSYLCGIQSSNELERHF